MLTTLLTTTLTTPLHAAPSLSAESRTGTRAGTTVLVAAAFVLLWAFSLGRSLFDPMSFDQALYQYMAERVIAGDRLYVDVWDQNAPGIVAVHWLSTRLVGTSPMALRVFDAVWQALTLAALVGLAWRDGRRWLVGWLAASLYVLCYYSMGYVHTAQREGFIVLPLLLMIHLAIEPGSGSRITPQHAPARDEPPSLLRRCLQTATSPGVRFFLAGMAGLFIFSIKPPLGLAFGAIWIHTLAGAWSRRERGLWAALGAPVALTLGFVIAAAGAVAWLAWLGSWDACWGALSRRDVPGYVLGPRLIRTALPMLAAGSLLLVWVSLLVNRGRGDGTIRRSVRLCVMLVPLFALLLTARLWPDWRHVLNCFAGLWIPAAGALVVCSWRERSETWRLAAWLLLAVTGAIVLQGQFFIYHLPPMFALAAYLAGVEIADRLKFPTQPASAWLAVCLACVACLAVGQWWPTMALATTRPYVLANRSLAEHYTSITKHKLSRPTYATTRKATDRIRELTGESEPIAILFHEARIYYFARRPCVHKLLGIHVAFEHMFPDYMQAIRERKPKVLVGRIPEPLRQSDDLQAIQAAVFAEARAFFGPSADVVAEMYRVTELIDDVCLLEPRN